MKTGLKILTVEDESAVAHLLALVLCGPKCKVTAANDGVAGLAKIAAAVQPFDVIITDHKTPRMTSSWCAGFARRNLRAKSLSSPPSSTKRTPAPTRRSGSIFSWPKPFDMDELRHAIDILTEEAPVYAQRATG